MLHGYLMGAATRRKDGVLLAYGLLVPLPPDARRRLSSPLRGEVFSIVSLHTSHSLPIPEAAWAAHAGALSSSLTSLATSTPTVAAGYNRCRQGVEDVKSHATHVVSHLLSTQPFTPFDHEAAERLLRLIVDRLGVVADHIEAGLEIGFDEGLLSAAEQWRRPAGNSDVEASLREAFAMSSSPMDPTGLFRPEWVLEHYAYRTGDLVPLLLRHLDSLGVPGLSDTLAAITVIGEIVSSADPVTAYVEMDAMVGRVLAAGHSTRGAVLQHLSQVEPAMRRARSAAARSAQTVRDAAAPTEVRANALADGYKRLVEGPFRQFAWALYCLGEGTWEKPPTLGVLRDRLVSAGGGLAQITTDVVISELRNGEAHETLVWDGFAEQFIAEGVLISPTSVVESANLAQSLVAGCEAGLAAIRFLDIPSTPPLLPLPGEQGRMPAWRRVQAFFGTNRLRLLDASLNTRHAALRVARLGLTDVNPCFQALVLAHRLMPDVETFSVSGVDGIPVIQVDANSLSACMPAWEFAVSHLTQIPLSTFLAANLSARMRHEANGVANRSAAWIAVDDAVGVIDGGPDSWADRDRDLVMTRLRVVELAVTSAEAWLGSTTPRLRSVAASAASLREWVANQAPSGPQLVDRRSEMKRLRLQWRAWGPVSRHPLVPDVDERDSDPRQPQLRAAPESLAFRLL